MVSVSFLYQTHCWETPGGRVKVRSSMFLPHLLGYRQRCWVCSEAAGGEQPRTQHPTSASGSHPLAFPARDRAPSLGKRRREEWEAAGWEKTPVPSWGEIGKPPCSSPASTQMVPSVSLRSIPSCPSALQQVRKHREHPSSLFSTAVFCLTPAQPGCCSSWHSQVFTDDASPSPQPGFVGEEMVSPFCLAPFYGTSPALL